MKKTKDYDNANHVITVMEARKRISEMNLINGFLFDSIMEDETDAQVLVGTILKTVFDREISNISIDPQKVIKALDTDLHGICLDAFISEDASGELKATVYDIEMEDRAADKPALPKRLRYYNALTDQRLLESGSDYVKLPDLVSITILSYDPFDAGDMYYEAGSILKTHRQIPYDDGILHIYLYCNGKNNLNDSHGKRIQEMLRYIVSGEKPCHANEDIDNLDNLVQNAKGRKEITTKFMKQWDRENQIRREVEEITREKTREETKREDALAMIKTCIEDNIPEITVRNIVRKFGFENEEIDALIREATPKK